MNTITIRSKPKLMDESNYCYIIDKSHNGKVSKIILCY